jgi:beta-phosphoglucomutase
VSDPLAVIFDMDGVLVDSYQAHLEAWQVSAGAYGLEMSVEMFGKTFGRTSPDSIRMAWPGKFDESGIKRFEDEKEAAYRAAVKAHFCEVKGAGNLVLALHGAGFRMAIGSSAPAENVAVVKQCIPNGQWITAVVSGSEVQRGKPDPQVFLMAAKKLGIEPSHCAVIEDAVVGVEAARRAGMASIGLVGTAPREALGKHAHLVVDSLTELNPAVIEERIRSNKIAG